jgi:hypothetical protein
MRKTISQGRIFSMGCDCGIVYSSTIRTLAVKKLMLHCRTVHKIHLDMHKNIPECKGVYIRSGNTYKDIESGLTKHSKTKLAVQSHKHMIKQLINGGRLNSII